MLPGRNSENSVDTDRQTTTYTTKLVHTSNGLNALMVMQLGCKYKDQMYI